MLTLSRTSLTAFAGSMRDADPEGARRAARDLWLEHGIAVIRPGDCEKLDAMMVEAIATRIHGKRAARPPQP